MLEYKRGDMFTTTADALVVAVNCVGVMGAGQAKEFAQHYPIAAKNYYADCRQGVKPGDAWLLAANSYDLSLYAAATKNHWRDASQYQWVQKCIVNLSNIINEFDVASIAIPRLGCGLGGLKWSDVEPMFQQHFEATSAYTVEIWSK